MDRAKAMYGMHHGVAPGDVTLEMLNASEKGMEGWANCGLDVKARGPVGNALYRQLRKNEPAAEAYRWLFEDLKTKFREVWNVHRTFDFISTKRIRSITSKTTREEVGSWKSELQLQQHFGGVDQPEAIRQAANYIRKCNEYKDSPKVSTSRDSIRTSFSSTTSGLTP